MHRCNLTAMVLCEYRSLDMKGGYISDIVLHPSPRILVLDAQNLCPYICFISSTFLSQKCVWQNLLNFLIQTLSHCHAMEPTSEFIYVHT